MTMDENKFKKLQIWLREQDENYTIEELKELKELNLSDKQPPIQSIPDEISLLTNLEILHLNNNHLKSLPSCICELTRLRELWSMYGMFSTLPPEIGRLINLEKLDLSNNTLHCLPAEIGKLTELKILWLSYNNLTGLPEEIRHLTSLKEFYMDGNPFPVSDRKHIENFFPDCLIDWEIQ